MSVSVHAAADYFVHKVDREAGDDMTHFKLQKMLYYAQAWYLAMHDERLFDNAFEGWVHGPVCREIYDRFRHLGWSPIAVEDAASTTIPFDEEISAFLDEVWEVYGQYTAAKLEQMTHQEEPWLEARHGCSPTTSGHTELNDDTMRSFYRMRMLARRRIRER
jgi:uncharacterized phage-associated protein